MRTVMYLVLGIFEFGAKIDMSIDENGIAFLEQIYCNRANRAYCKEHGIRISGSAHVTPKQMISEERERAYADNTEQTRLSVSC